MRQPEPDPTAEDLLESLRARIRAVLAGGDTSAVLDDDALAEADELWRSGRQPGAAGTASVSVTLLWHVAMLHWLRYQALPDGAGEGDLSFALSMFVDVYRARPDVVPDEVLRMYDDGVLPQAPAAAVQTAVIMLKQTARNHDSAVLDAAIGKLERVIAGTSPQDHELAGYQMILSQALQMRFAFVGDVADLDRAVGAAESASRIEGTPAVLREACLDALSEVLQVRFDRVGDMADLVRAIDVANAAAASARRRSDAEADSAKVATALYLRYRRAGQMSDLDEAIRILRNRVDRGPEPASGTDLKNLSLALHARFDRSGDDDDLEDAIRFARAAVDGLPARHARLLGRHVALAMGLAKRSYHSGSVNDLEEAIGLLRGVIRSAPVKNPDVLVWKHDLSLALRYRHSLLGESADLDEAITLAAAVAEVIAPDDPSRPVYFSNSSELFLRRFERNGRPADWERAVLAARSALAAARDEDPARAGYLTQLSRALVGGLRRGEGHPVDLDHAVSFSRAAVKASEGSAVQVAIHGVALTEALLARYDVARDADDLEDAVSVAGSVVASDAADRPALGGAGLWLAFALRRRFEGTRDTADALAALASFRAVASIPQMAAADRIHALDEAGALASQIGRLAEARELWATAVRMLPVLAWRGLGRRSREGLLGKFNGMAADAAQAAIGAGSIGDALILLEQGRGVLWSLQLEMRGDHSQLRETRPDLAERLDSARRELDGGSVAGLDRIGPRSS